MISFIISTLCLQINNIPDASKYYSSCISSATAASIQTGIKPNFDRFENDFQKQVKRETGERIWAVIGAAYAFQQKGSLNLNLGAKPYIDSIQLTANPSGSGNINLIWYF